MALDRRAYAIAPFMLGIVVGSLVLVPPAGAQTDPLAASAPVETPAPAPAAPELSPFEVELEVLRLRTALAAEVKHTARRTPENDQQWIARTRAAITAANVTLDRPQLVAVVDRSPANQAIRIIMVRPAGAWEVIGGASISSGQGGRFDHYITPTGVFRNTDGILGYRAEGTYNENRIRGLGVRGMRVWDFGWQAAYRGWGTDHSPGQIRLEMHATDPDVLERRLGRPASQGCVRLSSDMNRFLDYHGVIDADYEHAALTDIRYRALLLPDRKPTPLAGNALVVVDSSEAPRLAISAR